MAFMHFGNFLEGMRLSASDIADREKAELNRRYMDEQMQTMQLAREMNRDELGDRPEQRRLRSIAEEREAGQYAQEQQTRQLALERNAALAGVKTAAKLTAVDIQRGIDADVRAKGGKSPYAGFTAVDTPEGVEIVEAVTGRAVSNAGPRVSYEWQEQALDSSVPEGAYVKDPEFSGGYRKATDRDVGAELWVKDPEFSGGMRRHKAPEVTRNMSTSHGARSAESAISVDPRRTKLSKLEAQDFVYRLFGEQGSELEEQKKHERGLADARARSGGASSLRMKDNAAFIAERNAANTAYREYSKTMNELELLGGKIGPEEHARKLAAANAHLQEYQSATARMQQVPPMFVDGAPVDAYGRPWGAVSAPATGAAPPPPASAGAPAGVTPDKMGWKETGPKSGKFQDPQGRIWTYSKEKKNWFTREDGASVMWDASAAGPQSVYAGWAKGQK